MKDKKLFNKTIMLFIEYLRLHTTIYTKTYHTFFLEEFIENTDM